MAVLAGLKQYRRFNRTIRLATRDFQQWAGFSAVPIVKIRYAYIKARAVSIIRSYNVTIVFIAPSIGNLHAPRVTCSRAARGTVVPSFYSTTRKSLLDRSHNRRSNRRRFVFQTRAVSTRLRRYERGGGIHFAEESNRYIHVRPRMIINSFLFHRAEECSNFFPRSFVSSIYFIARCMHVAREKSRPRDTRALLPEAFVCISGHPYRPR